MVVVGVDFRFPNSKVWHLVVWCGGGAGPIRSTHLDFRFHSTDFNFQTEFIITPSTILGYSSLSCE